MPLIEDPFDRNMKYFRESGAVPQASYMSQSVSIRQGQIINCIESNTYWYCTNSVPINQSALTWQRLLNAPIITIPTFNSVTTAQKLSQYLCAKVNYAFPVNYGATLVIGQTINAFLRYADDEEMSENVVTIDMDSAIIESGLVVTLGKMLKLNGIIPPNKFRQVTFSVTGAGATAPSVLSSGQEYLE